MPYVFFKCPAELRAIIPPLTRYLSLSGVNLREEFAPRPDGIGLVLSGGTPAVFCRAAGIRFGRSVAVSMRSVLPKTLFRQDNTLPFFAVPTVFVRLPETLDPDAAARILANAVQHYFLLPALPDRPEAPARIGDLPARMFTVADGRSRILQRLDAGFPVTFLGSSGEWSVIRCHGELGFCRTENLRLI